jgi:2-oxoglutarate dehydrogenase E2 component (dihydrolipoamide succinyltransferase)
MIVEIKVPTPGESITEVEIANWLVSDGDLVEKNQELAEVESDKATLALVATESGKIGNMVSAGTTVKVNSVACTIDTSFSLSETGMSAKPDEQAFQPKPEKQQVPEKTVEKTVLPVADELKQVKVSPVARQVMAEHHLSIEDVVNGLRRISAADVKLSMKSQEKDKVFEAVPHDSEISRGAERQKMSQLRKKLSQRLVAVKNETAMLTTFNEVDMSGVMNLRSKYNKEFQEKFGVKLGFMSVFIKAAAIALKVHPMVNSMIEGDDFVIPDYVDISVAVQTPKGLMVPVIRNVETLSLSEIEIHLKELAEKARTGKISLEEMTGGTFTITNGGVFGSMLSTPLINPPQSGILGMHNIVERPMAVNGKVEIRPMMYVALSYDHRIIDGKDSVGFLKKVKELIESPVQLLTQGVDPEKLMLGL